MAALARAPRCRAAVWSLRPRRSRWRKYTRAWVRGRARSRGARARGLAAGRLQHRTWTARSTRARATERAQARIRGGPKRGAGLMCGRCWRAWRGGWQTAKQTSQPRKTTSPPSSHRSRGRQSVSEIHQVLFSLSV